MEHENLNEFRCCLSDCEHFFIQPVTLPKCGHSACKECFPKDNQKIIKCKKCNVVSEFDFKTFQVSAALKIATKFLCENMFKVLEQETISKINQLKSN